MTMEEKIMARIKELKRIKKEELKGVKGYDRAYIANLYDSKINELERLLEL